MFINCKHCGSLVATDPATDQPPERCPRCRGVLRTPAPPVSVAALLKTPTAAVDVPAPVDAMPAARSAPGAVQDAVVDAAAPIDAPVAPAADVVPVRGADPASAAASADPAVAAPAPRPASPAASPSFARRGATRVPDARMRRQHRILCCAVVALTMLLGLQVLLADRARLASDPAWRPALARLCGVLRCSLPPWREPAALTVLARDVRPDDARSGQLLATATFRNDARWPQAWPRLRLTLSDIDGRALGTRVFTAQEYLEDAPDRPMLAAGDSAQARLQLVEPDARAVSFAFDFL